MSLIIGIYEDTKFVFFPVNSFLEKIFKEEGCFGVCYC